jgi:NAD-dependent SIR2 family protein deacetylase
MYGHAALILGAGFSKPAGGPLLRELLTEDVVAHSEAQSGALAVLASLLQERQSTNTASTIETLFSEVWREAHTGGTIGSRGESWLAADLLNELTVHLSSVCGRVHARRSSNLWANYLHFFDDLYRNSKSLAVMTFNYDMLVEQILDDLELRFDYGTSVGIRFENSKRRQRLSRAGPQVSVMKLHGSSNWGVCRGCSESGRAPDLITAFEGAYTRTRRKRCPACESKSKFLDTGIIPPILGKAGEAQREKTVWEAARKTLKRAREIIVIGYSLPPSDTEAKSLLSEVPFLGRRPRIRIACGPGGAPSTYLEVFGKRFKDTGLYTEDLLSGWA